MAVVPGRFLEPASIMQIAFDPVAELVIVPPQAERA
jgi:hypothetical protein